MGKQLYFIFIKIFLFISTPTFSQSGSIDSNFNIGTGASSTINASVIQPDGKIIIGGLFQLFNGDNLEKIARLNINGSIDNSFNIGLGFFALNGIFALALQNDGKIIVGGDFVSFNGTSAVGLIRLNPNGTYDPSFQVLTGPPNVAFKRIDCIKIQPDGKILAAGLFNYYNTTLYGDLLRYNNDGTLDTTFNTGFSISMTTSPGIFAIELQSDGKIIIGGRFLQYNGTNMNSLVRLNVDGTLDPTFDTRNGLVGITWPANAPNAVFAIAIQNDGKIIIGGDFITYQGTSQYYLARLNSDGSPDGSFNNGNVALSGIQVSGTEISEIKILCDESILISGRFSFYDGIARNNIARLHKDGRLDLDFNPTGIDLFKYISTIAIQNDGNLIIGGTMYVNNPNIARLNSKHMNPTFDKIIVSDTCFSDNTRFSISNTFEYDSLRWNFDDPNSGLLNTSTEVNPSHLFTSPSTFNISVTAYYCKSISIISKQLTINSKPIVTLGNDTILCAGDSLRINVNPGFSQYFWSTNSTNNFEVAKKSSKYWVRATEKGCSGSDTIIVEFIDYPTVNIGNDTTLCIGDSVKSTVSSGLSYLWSNNSINNSILIKTQGKYWVRVTNYGCSTSDTLNINFVNRPLINLGVDTILCSGDSIGLTVNPGFDYLWSTNNTSNSIKIKSSGQFWCKISNSGCINSDTINVNFIDYPEIELGSDTTFCINKFYTLNPDKNSSYDYLWSNSSTNSHLTVNTSGKYWVRVSNNHCVSSDTIDIIFDTYKNLMASASKDTVGYSESIQFYATGNNFLNYVWNFTDGITSQGQNTNHTFNSSGEYNVILQAININNCIISKEIPIVVKEVLFIPNLFTPNDDNSNDLFEIIYNGKSYYHLKIFNRWGEQIFSSTEKSYLWDGSNVSDGVYYYYLNIGSKNYAGWVQLIK